jgi:hypothetical protein
VLGAMRSGTDLPGNEAFPSFSQAGLALRMEVIRRQMLAELSQ